MNTQKVETEFTLPNVTVKLKPVKKVRGKGGEITLQHEANFLFNNAKNTYEADIYKKGNYVSPLTREEQKFFESPEKSGLSFTPGDLAVDRQTNNYWTSKRARFSLSEDSVTFDLSRPLDYLKMKILLSHNDQFAEKPEHLEHGNVNRKATYRYVFIRSGYEAEKKSQDYHSEAEMWKFMFAIENNVAQMSNMLTLLNPKKQLPKDVSKTFLLGELKSFIKNDPKRFSLIMREEDLELKSILKRSLDKKLIKVDGIVHTLATGEILGDNRKEALEFLKDEGNQAVVDKLKVKLGLN